MIRAIGATLGRQVLTSVGGLVTSIVVARHYGPEGNGSFAIALLLPTILTTFLNMGLNSANVYYLGSSKVKLRQLISSNVKILMVLIALGVLLAYLFLVISGGAIFPQIDPVALWLAIAIFPLSISNAFLMSVFQGLQQFGHVNRIAVIQSLVNLLLILTLTLTERRVVTDLIVIQITVNIGIFALAFIWLRPMFKIVDVSDAQTGVGKILLGYGWKAHLSNIVAFLNAKADVFILNLLSGPIAVGVYVIAVALSERLWVISQATNTILLPHLAQLSNDEGRRNSLTPIASRWVVLITIVAAIMFALIGYPLIIYFFGEKYRDALIPLWIMLPGFVLAAMSQVFANDFAARGRPELNLATSVIVMCINVIGNIILIPIMDLYGAAVSISIAMAINAVLKLTLYCYISGNNWRSCLFVSLIELRALRRMLHS